MPSKTSTHLKILFMPMDGVGHLNACIGLAQGFTKRGHQVSFLLNEAFTGKLATLGFGELLLRNPTSPDTPSSGNPIKDNAENLRKAGYFSPASTLEKMKQQIGILQEKNEFLAAFYAQLLVYNSQIEDHLQVERPDLIIVDTFLVPPAIQASNTMWAFLCSCNPLALLSSPSLPPHSSGYPADSDRATWRAFREVFRQLTSKCYHPYQTMLDKALGYTPKVNIIDPELPFHKSPYMNIIGFPRELDYTDLEAHPANFVTLDAFLREEATSEALALPDEFQPQSVGSQLIYVSLGTIVSLDVSLMRRILSVLARTPYRYIVSKGALGDEIDLPVNCWGRPFLPQTQVIPLVDLVITHGGNNTVTETFANGKPMIVFPMFGDQPDNAQRVMEKGFGVRLEPYTFQDHELIDALDRLLNDENLKARLEAAKRRIEEENSKDKACQKMEQMVAQFKVERQVLGS